MKKQHTPTFGELASNGLVSAPDCQHKFIEIIEPTGGGNARKIARGIYSEEYSNEIIKRWNLHDELVSTLEYVEKYLKKDNGGGDESVWAYVQQALKRAKGGGNGNG